MSSIFNYSTLIVYTKHVLIVRNCPDLSDNMNYV